MAGIARRAIGFIKDPFRIFSRRRANREEAAAKADVRVSGAFRQPQPKGADPKQSQ